MGDVWDSTADDEPERSAPAGSPLEPPGGVPADQPPGGAPAGEGADPFDRDRVVALLGELEHDVAIVESAMDAVEAGDHAAVEAALARLAGGVPSDPSPPSPPGSPPEPQGH